MYKIHFLHFRCRITCELKRNTHFSIGIGKICIRNLIPVEFKRIQKDIYCNIIHKQWANCPARFANLSCALQKTAIWEIKHDCPT